MTQKFDREAFAKAVKIKRVIDLDMGVRGVAKLTGMSAATISRMENGNVIEMDKFITACNWLGVSVCEFIKPLKAGK